MKKQIASYITLCFISFFTGTALAAGEQSPEVVLDSTFGDGGTVVTSLGSFQDRAHAAALQEDGKIVVGGSVSNGVDLDFGLARYNPDGILDSSFNGEGTVVSALGGGNEEISALAVQDDGKIVAAGYATNETDRDFVLVRYTTDGVLDSEFGQSGVVTTAVATGDEEITALEVDSQGRLLVAGYVTGTQGRVAVVARYLTDGTLDSSFGDQGLGDMVGVGDDFAPSAMFVQDDGAILLSGTYTDGDHQGLVIIRYLADGFFDNSFGTDGLAVPADGTQNSAGNALALWNDGSSDDSSIMVAGAIGDEATGRDAALFRFSSSGAVDTSFGQEGAMTLGSDTADDVALALALDGGGLLVAGFSEASGVNNFVLHYVTSDALSATQASTTDSTEAATVVSVTTFDDFAEAHALVAQSDGKVIAAGFVEESGISRFAVVRYSIGSTTTDDTTGGGEVTTQDSGEVVSFISTSEATAITRTTAVTGGVIGASGDVIFSQRGVVFSTKPNPTYTTTTEESTSDGSSDDGTSGDSTSDDGTSSDDTTATETTSGIATATFKTEGQTSDGSGTGGFSSSLSDLQPGTFYYVRAYAIGEDGSVYYGNTVGFTTADSCFIATAAFGSVFHPAVKILRDFRNRYLVPNVSGQRLVELYYHYSPPIAAVIEAHALLRGVTCLLLLPLIGLSWLAMQIGLSGVLLCGTVAAGASWLWFTRRRPLCAGASSGRDFFNQ